MRAPFLHTHPGASKRRALLFAALLLAALCTLSLSEASAPAKTPQEKLDATQGKLAHVRESQSSLAETIAEQNAAIDSMIGEVSALRQKQAAVEAELAEKQRELDQATAALEKEKEHLEEVREQLNRALGVLRERLVAIYEAGSPDVVNAILESDNWSQMAVQTEYLNRIQSYDDSVVVRVKTLRNQVSDAVARLADTRAKIESARDAIATTPYIWGGGHGSFESSGYDCSGAVSYALHGGGFLESPLDSTGLETWGEPGPGKWITVYANAEHAWMMIAGLAFDTVGGPGPRWHSSPVDSPEGFIARHPPGY